MLPIPAQAYNERPASDAVDSRECPYVLDNLLLEQLSRLVHVPLRRICEVITYLLLLLFLGLQQLPVFVLERQQHPQPWRLVGLQDVAQGCLALDQARLIVHALTSCAAWLSHVARELFELALKAFGSNVDVLWNLGPKKSDHGRSWSKIFHSEAHSST